jgi:hypothetical protein
MSIHVSLFCIWINFMPPESCVLKNCFYSLFERLVCGVGGGGVNLKSVSIFVSFKL